MDLKNLTNDICKICNQIFTNRRSFVAHLFNCHKISQKQYYDKYIRLSDEGICPICGNETNFYNLKKGYMICCSKSCASKNRKHTKETKNKISSSNRNVAKGALKKRKKTCLKKYGVENPYQSEEIKEKIKQTNLEKYGVENPAQCGEIQEKYKQTCLERYGVDTAFKTQICREKIHSTQLNNVITRIKSLSNIVKPNFDLKSLEKVGYYDNLLEWTCSLCNNIFEDCLYSAKIPRCLKCFPLLGYGKQSNIEKEIQNFLIKEINCITNKRYEKYELDIFIPSKNIGIEFDGIYWHSEKYKDKNYHIDKTNWFKENFNIDVIHIFENEWLYKQEIVKSILLNKIGKTKNKIFARKTKFQEISSEQYRNFLEENHIQAAINSKYRYGLFFEDKLVSTIGFGKSRFKKDEMELHRFCNKLNTSVIGGFSKLLKNSHFRGYTYCDRRYSNAIGYIKNNFIFDKITNPNYFYFKNGDVFLYSRIQFQKHKLKDKLEFFDPSLTEWENMQANGWNRIWDCGNIKLKYGV